MAESLDKANTQKWSHVIMRKVMLKDSIGFIQRISQILFSGSSRVSNEAFVSKI